MAIGILGSALSGLAAFQRSLEVTSNNISNVNTEGYSRQRVELQTSPEQFVGHGYLGSGVNATNIKRSYDEFVNTQQRSSATAFNDVDSFYLLSTQMDNLIANESTGLSPAMKSFFNAVNDVANDPTSIPARQVMLSEGDAIARQFNTMSNRFDDLRQQVNSNLDTSVKEVNSFTKSIADLNRRIMDAVGKTSGQQLPNELMDQRDLLLSKVAEKMDISVVPQPDGSFSIFTQQGQPLVLGTNASSLSLQGAANDPSHLLVKLNGEDITGNLTGGEIYGNLRFRDEMLDSAQNQLGLLATGLAIEFNKVHQDGYDLNDNPGLKFFDLGSPTNLPVVSNVQDSNLTVTADFVAPTAAVNLGASYRVEVTGVAPNNVYTLTNLSDNSIAAGLSDAGLAAFGFNLNFSGAGSVNIGDSFKVSPFFKAAESIKINPAISTPGQIAAAGAKNQPGDNSKALELAGLESLNLMFGGKSSFTQVYGQLVSDVGSKTHNASVSRSAQKVLLDQATQAREDLVGVNLDEEAANLIKFQNSYQAAAKAVSVANALFDSLLGVIR
ncbi:MAG: flagellar hook-associated protein FlgK [Methylomonas sp.]|jgi:flagellar hook-associated protein 1 FlgK|uniref:flagellar hook-associated protein FlgK n=1 Tax=Methylomonas sp. TaxID=418 RepID=UPI0025FCDC4F|nr:flagellar hook-associated protein FlgK [Methylomonas sp.]MCK9606434.1 flagellar hook-associated protein FlgK [Methylomonas sp.]